MRASGSNKAWGAKANLLLNEHGEESTPKMKTAVLTPMLPNELQDIVFQNAEGEFKYETARDEIVSLAGYRIQLASPTPMDIGAVDNSTGHCNHNHEEPWSPEVTSGKKIPSSRSRPTVSTKRSTDWWSIPGMAPIGSEMPVPGTTKWG